MADESGGNKLVTLASRQNQDVLNAESHELQEENAAKERIRRMAEVRRLNLPELEKQKIIYPGMQRQQVLNAFRELRTKLYQVAGQEKNFVMMVTSLAPGGGASFVGLNLGAAIALDESKTAVLVDCNFFQPSLDRLLGASPDHGLADYLEDVSLGIEDIIYSTGVRRLRLIPAGGHREPGFEFFTSVRMKRFISELRERYRDRYVIIDAPPLDEFADARILAELCDFAVLVVPYGRVTQHQIDVAIEAISREKLVGVIFNH